ncbi:hypothetical protein [Flagellimonas nanhaiensis]|uniref:DUF4252 domain-containing protein n=1 Tax=Flagellimonas nanhaiensis TaxID=2292706 RepID=A0A371JTU6_9FLAO|nr:hypothetical protein [Allomuricauda nanhaiensis]RDY61243.1 hypothetical protein DX873_03490 [Allomuricauda nanhaiensis]
MKTGTALLLALSLSLCFTSCIDFKTKKKEVTATEVAGEDFNQIEVNGEYRLSLPKYMRKTDNLNEEASLQYQNIFKETYTIVIDESKDDFIEMFTELGEYDENISVIKNYRDVQQQLFAESMYVDKESSPIALEINGMEAEMVDIDGRVDGIDEDITYFLTFVEGKEKVYMIMSWTMTSRKDTYESTFDGIAKSFKLIN